MSFQPQRTSVDDRIDTDVLPPSRFIAAAMHFAVVAPAQRDGELIADFAAEGR